MTSPSSPTRYPPEFLRAFLSLQSSGLEEISIPSGNPNALKTRFWAFQRALRLAGQAELADSVKVSVRENSVLLQNRSATLEAREVAAALSFLPVPPPSQEEDFFDRVSTPNATSESPIK